MLDYSTPYIPDLKHLDFMRSKTVCFFNHGKVMKKSILRTLADSFESAGIRVVYGDQDEKIDVYIFEKFLEPTRYDSVKIIHAENLIGKETLEHSFNNADGIVYNSHWLRQVYLNTFPTEIANWEIIAPSLRFRPQVNRIGEYQIVCISKWWKRPFKRFPLIAEAFALLTEDDSYRDAKLHVFGWAANDKKLPYTSGLFPLVKLSRRAKNNKNIIYYEKSFSEGRNTYFEQLHKSHLMIHMSTIDSGPQVVTEAFANGVPLVVSNNMGGAEWMREIGPQSGIVLDIDELTDSYQKISKLPLYSRRLCSDISHAPKVAEAMKTILDNPDYYSYVPPRKYRLEGTMDAWFELIQKAWQTKHA
jgi:glycosyltransferase involved in cell wall biosynthesis